MGRRSREDPQPVVQAALVVQGQPLTRREARERENAAASSRPQRDVPARRAALPRRAAAAPRPTPRSSAPSKVLSVAALAVASALVVGMSVPASAVMTGEIAAPTATSVASAIGDQTLDVSADATAPTQARDPFTVIDYAELTRELYGPQKFTYTVTTGAVRWPFPYASPISDGFGPRVAPCDGCSTMHLGVDFTPGAGTPIFAIADGVVTEHVDDYGSFGNHVIISHLINGQHIDSLYAHMQTGSSSLVAGQAIKVGDFIGLVGDTGESTGAHLHFEIHLDGVAIDPFAWLQANAVN